MTSTDTSRADALTDRAKWAIRLLEVAEPILDAAAAGKPVTIAAGDLLRQVRIFLPAAVPPVEQHEAAPAGAQRSGDPWDRGAVCPVCAGKPGEWTCPKTTNDMYNPRPEAGGGGRGEFQARVQPWMLACFGAEIAADRVERNHRFLEEALELVQACGCTASEAHQLVDYTFGRPIGEPAQEVGGVMVTLAALCLANGLDMHAAGETELARIWTKVEQIRAKQAAKPKHSPLPEAPAPASAPVGLTSDLRAELEWCATEGNCGPRTRSAIHQVLAAFPRQPEPRAEVAGSVARDICVSLECTAQWLEHGNDPKAAAIEIRMQIEKLARAGDAS
ncbi:hypothetical protein [Burkholderia anthina]|uniref:hypothetical protein n=1 Tax=Burkholderia anthina TaxID=179879 RepID=UPI0037C186D3